jgi:hypothetical protein
MKNLELAKKFLKDLDKKCMFVEKGKRCGEDSVEKGYCRGHLNRLKMEQEPSFDPRRRHRKSPRKSPHKSPRKHKTPRLSPKIKKLIRKIIRSMKT